MRCPAAPYFESVVVAEVLRICDEHRLACEIDRFGNVLVSLNKAPETTPFILAAHLDHPGFSIIEPLSATSYKAEFLGGVGDEYFKPGLSLRLMPGGTPAQLGPRIEKEKRVFEIVSRGPSAETPSFAVWELTDFERSGPHIVGRACDDLIGAATILHVLAELSLSEVRVNVTGALSRAEEVGFRGALALASSDKLSKNSLVVSLETSRELPSVKMGDGVIIRVGDRASVFDPTATRFLAEVAADFSIQDPQFRYQRALMSGGTCEATAYQELGFRTAAVCVALGNYHNCGPDQSIAAEYVSAADAESMSAFLQRAAIEMNNYAELTGRLPKRLANLQAEGVRELQLRKLSI